MAFLIELTVEPYLIQSFEFPFIDTRFSTIIEHLDSKSYSLPVIHSLKESLFSLEFILGPIKLNGGYLKLGQLVVPKSL